LTGLAVELRPVLNANFRLLQTCCRRHRMNFNTLLIVLLVILLLGALPTWPYSTGWGYYPSGGLFVLLVIALVLLFSRRGAV
jgi:hypothetical protein